MARVYQNVTNPTAKLGAFSPRADNMEKGTFVHEWELKITDATFSNDYSSGFPIRSDMEGKFFRRVYFVLGLSCANGGGTTLSDKVHFTWDDVNGKLRVWSGSTGATNWTEATGTQLTQNSTLQLLVFGV